MRLPQELPARIRIEDRSSSRGGENVVQLQGCDPLKKVACVASIAACVASGVGVVPCLAANAPHCIDCV